MHEPDELPNEQQRRQLCEMMHAVFIELRCVYHLPQQVHDLAYVFHNMPMTMYGWGGGWNWTEVRLGLASYRKRYPKGGPDYAAMLDAIGPEP